jgi:uncharacterized protein
LTDDGRRTTEGSRLRLSSSVLGPKKMKLVNSQNTRVYMGTLTGGVEIMAALRKMSVSHQIQTATINLLGGLTEVELSAYDFVAQRRLEPVVVKRPLEIIAGQGTISLLDEQPHVHLHLALAWREETAVQGISVIGGHCARALAFAVEFTLTAYDGAPMRRVWHEDTGLLLWET